MTLGELALVGKHKVYDTMAAGITHRLDDIRRESLKQSLSGFQGVEHRLEYVASVRGIEFINDSKATTLNGKWYALAKKARPIIWIAGGIDKDLDYSQLLETVVQKVKAIVCLGVNNRRLFEAFNRFVPLMFETQSAIEAVTIAYRLGQKGDTVLFSPGCPSFDLFDNYEDRGTQFKKAVINL